MQKPRFQPDSKHKEGRVRMDSRKYRRQLKRLRKQGRRQHQRRK